MPLNLCQPIKALSQSIMGKYEGGLMKAMDVTLSFLNFYKEKSRKVQESEQRTPFLWTRTTNYQ